MTDNDKPFNLPDWINQALVKLKSKISNIVFFETRDPERFKEFIKAIEQQKNVFISDNNYIFICESWKGVTKYKFEEDKLVLQKRELTAAQRLNPEQDNNPPIKQILSDIDSALNCDTGSEKEGRLQVVIFKNLVSCARNADNESLLSAFRNWVLNSNYSAKDVKIFVFTEDSSLFLDEHIKEIIPVIDIFSSTEEERKSTISARGLGLNAGIDNIEDIVKITSGLTIHELNSVLRESYTLKKGFDVEFIKNLRTELIKKSGVLEVVIPEEDFEIIGGYKEIKALVKNSFIDVMKKKDRAELFGVSLPRGLLFYGPPGTGKTLFAKAIARETLLPFVNFKAENIYSKYLGDSGQKTKQAIILVEQMSPAIVFIDEIDRFGRRIQSGDSAGEETRRVFSQILEWLGDRKRKSIIIGATNRKEDLDEAFIRPGRFDRHIEFPNPDMEGRIEILKIHLGLMGKRGSYKKPPLDKELETDLDKTLKKIAEATDKFSGADLEQLIKNARVNAFKSDLNYLTKKHLLTVLEEMLKEKNKAASNRG